MLSPAENPRMRPSKRVKQNEQPWQDKENLNRPNRSRSGISEHVIRTTREDELLDEVLPRKRRFADSYLADECTTQLLKPDHTVPNEDKENGHSLTRQRTLSEQVLQPIQAGSAVLGEAPSRRVLGEASSTVEDSVAAVQTRKNPFDEPLTKLEKAAPIRSYRPTKRLLTGSFKPSDPPPRKLVSYADLWEGISSIERQEEDEWMIDGYPSPNYDFLYDGVWTRCMGRFVVVVEKVVKPLAYRGTYKRYRCGKRPFRDLDRPPPHDW